MPYKNKEDKLNHNHRYFRSWYENNGGKRNRAEDYIQKIQEWQRNNPEKVRTAKKLYYAVKVGKIVKLDFCQDCGRRTRLGGHHYDYSKVFEVDWLCSSCHKLRHPRLNT